MTVSDRAKHGCAIHAVLFDLDGLMVDSEPHSLASWQAVMAKRGVSLETESLNGILGQRVIQTAQGFIERYQLTDSAQLCAKKK